MRSLFVDHAPGHSAFLPYPARGAGLPGADIIDCQGKFGDICQTPQPEYKHRLMATWNAPWGMQATATWRHIGDTEFSDDPAPAPIDEKLETQDYIDLVIRQQVTDNVRFRLGVNNLFNDNPPLRV